MGLLALIPLLFLLTATFSKRSAPVRSQGKKPLGLRDDAALQKKTSDPLFFFSPLIFQLPSSEKASDLHGGLQAVAVPPASISCLSGGSGAWRRGRSLSRRALRCSVSFVALNRLKLLKLILVSIIERIRLSLGNPRGVRRRLVCDPSVSLFGETRQSFGTNELLVLGNVGRSSAGLSWFPVGPALLSAAADDDDDATVKTSVELTANSRVCRVPESC